MYCPNYNSPMPHPDKHIPQKRLSAEKAKKYYQDLYNRTTTLLRRYADPGPYPQPLPQHEHAGYATTNTEGPRWFVEMYPTPGLIKLAEQTYEGNPAKSRLIFYRDIYLDGQVRRDQFFTQDKEERPDVAYTDPNTFETRYPETFPKLKDPLLNTRRSVRLAHGLLNNFEDFLKKNPGVLQRLDERRSNN